MLEDPKTRLVRPALLLQRQGRDGLDVQVLHGVGVEAGQGDVFALDLQFAVEAAVADGVAREFGAAPSAEIPGSWLDAARTLEERYRSREWNERR